MEKSKNSVAKAVAQIAVAAASAVYELIVIGADWLYSLAEAAAEDGVEGVFNKIGEDITWAYAAGKEFLEIMDLMCSLTQAKKLNSVCTGVTVGLTVVEYGEKYAETGSVVDASVAAGQVYLGDPADILTDAAKKSGKGKKRSISGSTSSQKTNGVSLSLLVDTSDEEVKSTLYSKLQQGDLLSSLDPNQWGHFDETSMLIASCKVTGGSQKCDPEPVFTGSSVDPLVLIIETKWKSSALTGSDTKSEATRNLLRDVIRKVVRAGVNSDDVQMDCGEPSSDSSDDAVSECRTTISIRNRKARSRSEEELSKSRINKELLLVGVGGDNIVSVKVVGSKNGTGASLRQPSQVQTILLLTISLLTASWTLYHM